MIAKNSPTLKSRISNPELRMPTQAASMAVKDITGTGFLTSDVSRSHHRAYSGTSSLSGCSRSDSLPKDYAIAKPRLSPMEYARRYLLKKAYTKRGDIVDLPAPRYQWFWTPQWEQFLIIPRIPPSIVRDLQMPCSTSTGQGPFVVPTETRKGESLVFIRDISSVLRHPRLSFNLQGVSALLPSVMNLISLGSSLDDNPYTSPKRRNSGNANIGTGTPELPLSQTVPNPSSAPSPWSIRNSLSESHDLVTHAGMEATYSQAGGIRLPESRRVAQLVSGISIASLRISTGMVSPIKSVYSALQDEEMSSRRSGRGNRYTLTPAPLKVRRQRRASISLSAVESPTPTRTATIAKDSGSLHSLSISPSTPSFRSLGTMLRGTSGFTPKSSKPGERMEEPARPDSPTLPSKSAIILERTPKRSLGSPKATPTRIPRRSVADRQATPYRPRLGISTAIDSSPLQKYASITPQKPKMMDDRDVPAIPKTPQLRGKSTFALHRDKSQLTATILPYVNNLGNANAFQTKTSSSNEGANSSYSLTRQPEASESLLKHSPRQLETPAATFRTLFRKRSRPYLPSTTPKTPTTPTTNWRPFEEGPGPLSPWHFADDDPEYRSPTPNYGRSQQTPSTRRRSKSLSERLESNTALFSPRRLQLAREIQPVRGIRRSGHTLYTDHQNV